MGKEGDLRRGSAGRQAMSCRPSELIIGFPVDVFNSTAIQADLRIVKRVRRPRGGVEWVTREHNSLEE